MHKSVQFQEYDALISLMMINQSDLEKDKKYVLLYYKASLE